MANKTNGIIMLTWLATAYLIAFGGAALAMEHTKVLPKGVRNVDMKVVTGNINEKTDAYGSRDALSKPLAQPLTFDKVAKEETGIKQAQLKAFMLQNGFSEGDSLGSYTGDIQGRVNVWAPIMSWGISDRLTLAVAVPVYSASTAVKVGFRPNDNANRFLNLLADPYANQVEAAQEAGGKLNRAVGFLNEKLVNNGYRSLQDWSATGVGDITMAAKYRALDSKRLAVATTFGAVAPTGRTDDPDILNDIEFGTGNWGIFGQVAADQPLGSWKLFLNEYLKHTYQIPGQKEVRMIGDDEPIVSEKRRVYFRLGDKTEMGASIQFEPAFGLVTGVGYSYLRKGQDSYAGAGASRDILERATDQEAHTAEAMLGYSAVPAYMRGEILAPFSLTLAYKYQLVSRNMPVTNLAEFDLNLFF